jgi:hypothetical protein
VGGNGQKQRVQESERGRCILYYENRRMKPVEIVLRRGEGMREKDGGNESN